MINAPSSANSIVGFDIDKYIKGDLSDNRDPSISAPVTLEQDTVEIGGKNKPKNEKGWKVFGGVVTSGVILGALTPYIIKAVKKFKA